MTTEPLDLRDLMRVASDAPWSGMPPGTTIGHVHLHVGGLDTAAAFYHAAIGFDQTVWSYPGALFLAAGGYHHHLGTNTWALGAVPARDDEARLLEWELVLPDSAAVERSPAASTPTGSSPPSTAMIAWRATLGYDGPPASRGHRPARLIAGVSSRRGR